MTAKHDEKVVLIGGALDGQGATVHMAADVYETAMADKYLRKTLHVGEKSFVVLWLHESLREASPAALILKLRDGYRGS